MSESKTNTLIQANINSLLALNDYILDQSEGGLTLKNTLLFGSTIGQHIRHILEFYHCLFKNNDFDISYDDRERKLALETNKGEMSNSIKVIISSLKDIKEDREINIRACFCEQGDNISDLKSSLYREIAYCLEHTIHHLIIIKIATLSTNPSYGFPDNFGVAYSTIRNNNKICAQ
jgi:hypothetical protein